MLKRVSLHTHGLVRYYELCNGLVPLSITCCSWHIIGMAASLNHQTAENLPACAGVCLFVITAGALPFDEPNLGLLFKKIQKADYQTPAWFSRDLAHLLRAIITPDPKARFVSLSLCVCAMQTSIMCSSLLLSWQHEVLLFLPKVYAAWAVPQALPEDTERSQLQVQKLLAQMSTA